MKNERIPGSMRFLRRERGFWLLLWAAGIFAIGVVARVPAIAPIGLAATLAVVLLYLLSFRVIGRPSTRDAEQLYTTIFGVPGVLLLSGAFFLAGTAPEMVENWPSLLLEVPLYGGVALGGLYILLISVVNRPR